MNARVVVAADQDFDAAPDGGPAIFCLRFILRSIGKQILYAKIVGDLLQTDLRKSIEVTEEKRVADAIAFAEASTFPEDQEIYDHVFAG